MDKELESTLSAAFTSALMMVSAESSVPVEIATFIPAVSPMIQNCFSLVLSSFFSTKKLTKSECLKLGISYQLAIKGINEKIESGARVRSDDFFEGDEHSKAYELLWAAIKSAVDDSEWKKSVCYGRLMQNIPFDSQCSESALVLLNKIISQISYEELCIIKLFYNKEAFDADAVDNYVKVHSDLDAFVIFNHFVHLRSLGVFINVASFNVGSNIGNIKLSFIGETLYRMLELALIPENDVAKIKVVLSSIGLFV